MRLVRFGEPGRERPGVLDGDGRVRDLSGHVDDITGALLEPQGLKAIAEIDPASLPVVGPVRLGACVGNVGKIVGIGLNYRDHALETGADLPAEPVIFLKATSSISGPDDDVVLPPDAKRADWEVELGVVIGQGGRFIARENALTHVAGYCLFNDVSERSYQIKRGGQWTKGKSCDTFGPLGPWLVTRDEIANPQNLALWLEIDGQRMQGGSTRDMIFPVDHLVSYVSHFMSLQSGDVIVTGTPAGVGMGHRPPVFLAEGMVMRLGGDCLGEQCQRVTAHRAVDQ